MKMQVTLKSGTQLVVDVEEFTVSSSRLTGETMEVKWTTPADWHTKLHHLNINEVAAIVALK